LFFAWDVQTFCIGFITTTETVIRMSSSGGYMSLCTSLTGSQHFVSFENVVAKHYQIS